MNTVSDFISYLVLNTRIVEVIIALGGLGIIIIVVVARVIFSNA